MRLGNQIPIGWIGLPNWMILIWSTSYRKFTRHWHHSRIRHSTTYQCTMGICVFTWLGLILESNHLEVKTCVIKLSSSLNLDDWHYCDAMWTENGANSISMKGSHFVLHAVVAIMLLCNRMGLIQTNHMTSWHFGTTLIPRRKESHGMRAM